MEKERPIILPVSIFLLFFLSIFLLREINVTGNLSKETVEKMNLYLLPIMTVIAIFIVFLITIIAFVVKKEKKTVSPINQTKTQPTNSDLISYVKQALDHGYNIEQIKDNLIKAGWPEDMVKAAISSVT